MDNSKSEVQNAKSEEEQNLVKIYLLREGDNKKALLGYKTKKRPFFVVFDYKGGGGGWRKCKKTTKLFYKLCFFWSVLE